MRNKCPYWRDTEEKPSDLGEGVSCKQTMKDTSDLYDKGALERGLSKAGVDVNDAMNEVAITAIDSW